MRHIQSVNTVPTTVHTVLPWKSSNPSHYRNPQRILRPQLHQYPFHYSEEQIQRRIDKPWHHRTPQSMCNGRHQAPCVISSTQRRHWPHPLGHNVPQEQMDIIENHCHYQDPLRVGCHYRATGWIHLGRGQRALRARRRCHGIPNSTSRHRHNSVGGEVAELFNDMLPPHIGPRFYIRP